MFELRITQVAAVVSDEYGTALSDRQRIFQASQPAFALFYFNIHGDLPSHRVEKRDHHKHTTSVHVHVHVSEEHRNS